VDAFPNFDVAKSTTVEPSEDAVALFFANEKARSYVYDHTACTWHAWRNSRWEPDTKNSVFDEVRNVTRRLRRSLDPSPSGMAKIAFCSAVERACRADPRLAVAQDVWDKDPWLLGVPAGVVDLRTGETRLARPDLYISRQTSVAPAPSGTAAPLWTEFLKAATNNNEELQAFLQRLAGYLLTGQVNEEVMAFLYGPGGNGKGVFIGTLVNIMAEYAVSMPIEVFVANSRINLEYYRAQMAGARLVTASETEAQATWAESQIKEMTGNETPLSARHPYGKPFEFMPVFKIVLVGNYAPKLKGRSLSMERRLRIVPFNHQPQVPDLQLKEKLRDEYPAILRWMIDGCLRWQAKGVGTAAVIAGATSAYFEQQDAFRRWLEERCDLRDPARSTKPGLLLTDFNSWAKENGEETVSTNAFAEMIDRTPELTRDKSHGIRIVRGVMLLPLGWKGRSSPDAAEEKGDEGDDPGRPFPATSPRACVGDLRYKPSGDVPRAPLPPFGDEVVL
jgi:putative DNA primase/helicase